ncbi:MAG TPA: DEAD/DEAH box helicase [Anaerohalosphaeraceae bacterium]|nr:DEAD/DEAH box helicase [Anaerohalosphaeraceae bacterium]
MAKKELTLKDRLSRLTFTQACKLLGDNGNKLIMQGGKFSMEPLEDKVYLGDDLFRLSVDGAVVTIALMAEARNRLHFNCTACQGACEHIGAAFSLILEEKTSLGLAKPPVERIPAESLNETELIARAMEERAERAKAERMKIESINSRILCTDYIVTNTLSGKSYRVALRGWERGQSYCTCPDFRKNTLGTCKHIMKVQHHVRRQFSSTTCNRPFEQKDFALHLTYGQDLQLRMLVPKNISGKAAELIKPFHERAIKDMVGLLRCVRKLEAMGHVVTIYPDAQEHIEFVLQQERLARLAAKIRKDPAAHSLRKTLLKAELLPYQFDGIAFAVGAGRAIIADDMGLGKTIQGIGAAELLAREAGIAKVLIVCPTSLKSQWRSEINRFCERPCQLVLGSAKERVAQYDNDCFFTICNYEQVMRDAKSIEKIRWDLIILDEGQRIKNWEAKTTQMMKSLRSRFALVLSGTPLENRLDDLFSVVEFVDDRRLGPSFRFFNTHRVVDEKGKLLGYKNLDKLREKLAPILLRRTRSEVMKQLPPRTDEVVRIPPTAEQYEINRNQKMIIQSIVNKAYISEMDLLRLQKALLICRMAADSTFLVDKQPPGFSTKLERLTELLETLNSEKDCKIVLFSEWTTMLDLIEPILQKLKMDFVRLDGSVSQKKRAQLVHTFQHNPNCKLFITTNAGSTGLNLQTANTVINVDLPWNPAVLEQRIARAHRMGQKNPVQVYILVTEQTIEEGMLGTLAAKKEVAMAALDIHSKVKNIDMIGGAEALKRRLEILLGRPQDAPLDVSELERQKQAAETTARREKVAVAAGELFTSAFKLLGEIIPHQSDESSMEQKIDSIKTHLQECLETNREGQIELKLKLPNQSALDNIAAALAKLTGSNI